MADKNLPRVFLDETDLECSGVEYHWCSANQIDTFNIEYLSKKEPAELVNHLKNVLVDAKHSLENTDEKNWVKGSIDLIDKALEKIKRSK